MTLQDMIKNYSKLDDNQKAHVDAALDSQDDDGLCICGKKLSEGDPECYSHMTQGY